MRDYDKKTAEFIEKVFARSDEILRQRQIQATDSSFEQSDEKPMPCDTKTSKIHHISYALPGLCAAFVLCFCIIGLSKYAKKINKDPNDNNPIVTTNTTTDNNITTTSTAIVTETTTTAAETTTDVNETTAAVTETSVTTDTSETVTKSDNEEEHVQEQPSEASNDNAESTENIATLATTAARMTETPVTITTVAKPTLCGDVNGDGMIDIYDCSIIKGYVERNDGITWADYYKNYNKLGSKLSAEQALANADAFKPSDKREITLDDAKAVLGHINGDYPELPINEL